MLTCLFVVLLCNNIKITKCSVHEQFTVITVHSSSIHRVTTYTYLRQFIANTVVHRVRNIPQVDFIKYVKSFAVYLYCTSILVLS